MSEGEEEYIKINSIYEQTNRPERRRPIGKSKNDEANPDIPSSEVSEDEREVSVDESEARVPSNYVRDKQFFGFKEYLVLFISILVFVVYYYSGNNEPTPSDWRSEINNMLRKFPNQPEDYKYHLRNGIQRILEKPSKPSTFLFVHNENEGRTSKLLAYEYAAIAVGAMGTKSPACLMYDKLKNHPNFENDFGWIIQHYVPEIQDHGVLIVLDLEKLPGNLAQAFHFLCDEFTPAVDKSIYIFTLNCNSTLSSNPVTTVEDILRNNWKTFLDEDMLQPLITRITNSVLVIQKESFEINNVHKFCE